MSLDLVAIKGLRGTSYVRPASEGKQALPFTARGNLLGTLQSDFCVCGHSSSTLGTLRHGRATDELGKPVGYFRPGPQLESMEVLFM